MNPQAERLNAILSKANLLIFLSSLGKESFFPKEGIVAQAQQAKGKKFDATVGMAVADDGSPMHLPCIAKYTSLRAEEVFPYASTYGLFVLRKLWKEEMQLKNPSLCAPTSLPIVTCGLTAALHLIGYLFCNQKDEIILPDLYWSNYKLIFETNFSAVIKTYPLFDQRRFNVQGLKEQLQSSTQKKIVLLNFPNNPTGYTLSTSEAQQIVEVFKECAEQGNKLLAILDDAYFGLCYESECLQESLFSLFADLHPNILALKVDGPTKEDFSWGLRVGFLTYATKGATEETYATLEDKTAAAIRATISNVSMLSQNLLARALKSPSYTDEKEHNFNILKNRYERVKKVLSDQKYISCFQALPFNSGYFLCLELQPGIDAEKVRQTLLQTYDTGVIAFPGKIRVAFSAIAEESLSPLFENIYQACLQQNA